MHHCKSNYSNPERCVFAKRNFIHCLVIQGVQRKSFYLITILTTVLIFGCSKVKNMSYKIYHNPRCSKSRQAINILTTHHIEPEIVEYLNTPVSEKEIRSILKMLQISAFDLIRKGEEEYKTLFKGKELSEEEWIRTMVSHPKLIERPIVIKDGKAVLGRPPEKILELIEN